MGPGRRPASATSGRRPSRLRVGRWVNRDTVDGVSDDSLRDGVDVVNLVDMKTDDRVTVRLGADLASRVDAVLAQLIEGAHGAELNRSDAVRVLVQHGLAAFESKGKKR